MELSNKSFQKQTTEKEHVSIEIMNEDVLLSSIKSKMDHISLSHCLSRIPQELLNGNKDKYFPSLVSIGPFHHGSQHTHKAMDDQKWRYLNALISRKPNAEANTLDSCIRALRRIEEKARKFYGETIDMDSDQFVEMMLVDSCFIIELFLEFANKSLRRRDDVCFSTNDETFHLRCDLILFENQVPFFILEKLFHVVPIPKQCHHMSLTELALTFFTKLIPQNHHNNPHFPPRIFTPQILHLLDLIRQHYLPTSPQILTTNKQTNKNNIENIPQATNLSTIGIGLHKTLTETPSNIKFFDGELKIPSLEIHEYTEILFRNLVAMENSRPGCSKHVTSYVVFMERLIRSRQDVRLLRDKEILVGGHESEGEIVLLFKKLHLDVNVEEFYYNGVCEQINGFEPRKEGLCEIIKHVYHKTHLGIAGFSLAIFILVFLFTGIFFSVLYFLLHHYHFQ